MGRRAKKAPVQTKKRATLAKKFKCPFCANDEVVECKMDHRAGVGSLSCRMCGASYQMPIHHLHEAVDVFSEWLDDCEAAERGEGTGGGPSGGAPGAGGGRGGYNSEDDDIDAPSGLSSKQIKRDDDDGGGKPSGRGKAGSSSLGLDDSEDDESD